MRHPAFDTGTDSNSRKAATEKENSKNEQQQQQKNQSKDQQASQSQQAQPQATGAGSQASSNSSAADASTQLSTQVDLNKTPSTPATSADVAAQLSAAQQALSAVDDEVSAVAQAEKIADDVNKMLSSICEPIYKALDNLKKLPPKLNKMVDVEGAKKGMYKQLDAFEDTWKKPYTVYVSVDVPITLDDYGQAPYKYPNLASIQRLTNTITEADCLSSGYKKTIISSYTELSVETNENFQNPTDQSITAKTCEKSLAVATKTAWTTIKPAISQIAGVAGFDQINGMMDSALEMIDGVVKLAETPIPEDKLNQKIREMQVGAANLANESANAKNAENPVNQTNDERIQKAKENAKKTKEKLLQEVQSVKETSENAFANMKMPPLPDGIDESLKDIWEAILNIVMNIQNLFIVVLFKLIEAVFKCLNQILSAIGVPTIPSPLNALPQLIVNAIDIMMFILGLPMSLVNQIKAIVKRKAKAVVVSQMPPPPKPVPEVVAIAPTSDDVPKPDLTWKDVQKALEVKWEMSIQTAKAIVDNLQAFFNGSDSKNDIIDESGEIIGESSTPVLVQINYIDSAKDGDVNSIPESISIKRTILMPQVALEEWIPQHIDTSAQPISITIPSKHTPNQKAFYTWKINASTNKWEKVYKTDTFQWEQATYYSEQ